MSRKQKWDKYSDPEIVAHCLKGDQDAWRCLVARYKNLVYSIPSRYHLQPADAADVFQEVWFDLYKELPKLREAGSLRFWLATATARKCLRVKARSARHDELQDMPSSETEMEEDVLQALREQSLRDAIGQLPERCQTLIRLLFFEHPPLSYREIGTRLRVAEGSVGFIRGRCLRKLLTILKEKGL
ncbi:MAG: sigma-70 family RNA polymerase sigma factor [Bryobacterales bacterium]|nr:sigma-70 family RNA polymerase sigma factor [Bryobacterales bacterium]